VRMRAQIGCVRVNRPAALDRRGERRRGAEEAREQDSRAQDIGGHRGRVGGWIQILYRSTRWEGKGGGMLANHDMSSYMMAKDAQVF
jgi:hypothetical protein